MKLTVAAALFSVGLLTACFPQLTGQAPEPSTAEAVSLLGRPLFRPRFTPERSAILREQLEEARRRLRMEPENVDHWIWVGRRLGYLWQFRDAIDIYTRALEKFPNEPALYRHRGHRFITLRRFDLAITDLRKATKLIKGKPDQIEPDGMPNPAGIPTSTLHTNIWYHLGLAYYLKRDYSRALSAYEACLAASRNNDMEVATLDWMFMTLVRLGKRSRAMEVIEHIDRGTEVIENATYLKRILLYRGLIDPDHLMPRKTGIEEELNVATYGYGLANWYQNRGNPKRAIRLYRQVLSGSHWSAFGYIAAEAELARGSTIFTDDDSER